MRLKRTKQTHTHTHTQKRERNSRSPSSVAKALDGMRGRLGYDRHEYVGEHSQWIWVYSMKREQIKTEGGTVQSPKHSKLSRILAGTVQQGSESSAL